MKHSLCIEKPLRGAVRHRVRKLACETWFKERSLVVEVLQFHYLGTMVNRLITTFENFYNKSGQTGMPEPNV